MPEELLDFLVGVSKLSCLQFVFVCAILLSYSHNLDFYNLSVPAQNCELIAMGDPMEVDVPQKKGTKGVKRKADGGLEPPNKLQVCGFPTVILD